jgi:MFS family permease
VIARGLQGIAGALLVPSSLALIISTFSGPAQGKAIGTWTAWTGIAFVVGPLLGGFLVDTWSWRLIFAINAVPIVLTLGLLQSLHITEVQNERAKIDRLGALLCAVGLGGSVYALIEQGRYGWGSPMVYGSLVIGIGALLSFLRHEVQARSPMLPLELFSIRNFAVGNAATFAIYGALSVSTFLITVFVQQFGHYSAIAAGMALLPITLIMFGLSPRVGALAGKYGPRWFMASGPIICGLGMLWMLRVDNSVSYWPQLFPGVLLFGAGLSITVAPLTSAILGSIDSRQAGIGSAVNNAVARIAGLVAIAAVGIVIGSTLDLASFHSGIVMSAALLILGGCISAVGIENRSTVKEAKRPATT